MLCICSWIWPFWFKHGSPSRGMKVSMITGNKDLCVGACRCVCVCVCVCCPAVCILPHGLACAKSETWSLWKGTSQRALSSKSKPLCSGGLCPLIAALFSVGQIVELSETRGHGSKSRIRTSHSPSAAAVKVPLRSLGSFLYSRSAGRSSRL